MAKRKKSKKGKSKPKAKKVSLRKRILKWAFSAFVAVLLFFSAFVFAVYLGFWGPLPDAEELASLQDSKASFVYSSEGELLGSYYAINRDPVSYEQLPHALIDALVATEDERFYEHQGVDWRSLMRVFFKTIVLGDPSAGGGSTLTQQLVKNLFGRPDYGRLSMLVNKTREMLLAYRLETAFSKQDILALYFNTVSFSENTYGISAGARRFFNCEPQDLKIEEAAVLVGLLKANTYYNPRLNPKESQTRRNVVLQQMFRNGYLKQEEVDSLQALTLNIDYYNLDREGPAPYFLAQVEGELQAVLIGKVKADGSPWNAKIDGLRIYTTLSASSQKALRKAYESHLADWQNKFDAHWRGSDPWSEKPSFFERQLQATHQYKRLAAKGLSDEEIYQALSEKRSMELFHPAGMKKGEYSVLDSLSHYLSILRGASVLLNPQSGAVEAWLGGPDFRYLPFDGVRSRHSMASTVKPFIMAAALENGADPCTYLSAERLEYPDYDNWSPRNYDGKYEGLYSMAGALKKSINTVTVAWYFKTGGERVRALADKLGLGLDWPEGPTVSLGTASVSPLDLAKAYAVFANGGQSVQPYFIEKVETADGELLYHHEASAPEQLLSERTAQLINELLMGVSEEGTARSLKSIYGARQNWAAKTGTSQSYSDAWFVAYRPEIVSVTWMGGVSPLIRFRSGAFGSGSTMALPVLGKAVRQIERQTGTWEPLDSALASELDCPDYRDANLIDELKDLFQKEEGRPASESEGEGEEGLPWWKRIFKKKD